MAFFRRISSSSLWHYVGLNNNQLAPASDPLTMARVACHRCSFVPQGSRCTHEVPRLAEMPFLLIQPQSQADTLYGPFVERPPLYKEDVVARLLRNV